MGLGLNGGGAAAARFLAESGAKVLATDLRDEITLKPTLDKLSDLTVEYRLGEHLLADFSQADIVIKNPACKQDSPFLQAATQIETDLSLFLKLSSNPILAVTGSKGKSTTVSALYQMLKESEHNAFLGGNITVSPLSFFDQTQEHPDAPVVLELSSWQLADIALVERQDKEAILKPEISVITNIMHDHQNAYSDFQHYVDDKKIIFQNQNEDSILICKEDHYGKQFCSESKAQTITVQEGLMEAEESVFLKEDLSGWIKSKGICQQLIPQQLTIKGNHNRINLLMAAAVAYCFGEDPKMIKESAQRFSGIPYRMETVASGIVGTTSVEWINDSAATMPDAMLASCDSYTDPVYLITGGTDKELDFTPYKEIPKNVEKIYLLAGNASEKLAPFLNPRYQETLQFNQFDKLIEEIKKDIETSTLRKAIILLSPGAASFGMFKNEFDRGDQFTKLALSK